MADRVHYMPGPAAGARVQKDGDRWTLILVRELRYPPALVWEALTEPAHLHEWAPFDADASLGKIGAVNLTWTGNARTSHTHVTRAEAPHLLELGDMRWELQPAGGGTRLTLWHSIDRGFVAWGAAGWHIAFDVLDSLLAGEPIGRIAGAEASKHGWQQLVSEYSQQFGIASPGGSPNPPGKS